MMKPAIGFEHLYDLFVDRRKRHPAHAPIREQAYARGRGFYNRGALMARVAGDPAVGFEDIYHWALKRLQEPTVTAQKSAGYVDGGIALLGDGKNFRQHRIHVLDDIETRFAAVK